MATQISRKAVPSGTYTPVQHTARTTSQTILATTSAYESLGTSHREDMPNRRDASIVCFQDLTILDLDPKPPIKFPSLDQKFVKWEISWDSSAAVVAPTCAGIALAVGHHLYYSLDGTPAGSTSRQQWALRYGSALAFLVVALLKTACDAAYHQHIWTLVKREALSLRSLDALFSLTTDPISFLSLELSRRIVVPVL